MKNLLLSFTLLIAFEANANYENVEKITCMNQGETISYIIYPNGFQSPQYPYEKKAIIQQFYQGNLAWENIYKINATQSQIHFSNPQMYYQDKTDLWVITEDFKKGFLSQKSFNFCYPGASCEVPRLSKIQCVFQ